MRVTLPYPPSANRYWRSFRGRTVLSAEAKAYKKQVAAILSAAGWKPATCDVAYTAHVYRPLRSGDLDNRLKVLGDALTGFAWVDDKQVVELHAYRHDDKANPRVEVAIFTFSEEAPKNTGAIMHPCAKCDGEAVAGTTRCAKHRVKNPLKRPPKVETAHRAAKKARDLLPKKHQDRLNEAGVVDLRDNMRLEHLGGGYARAVPIDPTKRHGDTPDWMAEAVREHQEELRKSRGVEGELQPLKGPLCEKRGCEESVRGPGAKYCRAH